MIRRLPRSAVAIWNFTGRKLSDAGREIFAASRAKRSVTNDADRLKKYLARFGLKFEGFRQSDPAA